jgi:hypothetical protein
MRRNEISLSATVAVATILWSGNQVPAAGPALLDPPATVEAIPATKLKRVTLKPSAFDRLGIEMAPAREASVSRKRTVSAEVVHASGAVDEGVPEAGIPGSGIARHRVVARVALEKSNLDLGSFEPIHDSTALVRVRSGEAHGTARDRTAIVVTANKAEGLRKLTGYPISVPPSPDLFYLVQSSELAPKQRVVVQLSSELKRRKAVPFSSIIHDEHGQTWVYVSPEPLVFVRHPVTIDYVSADTAFLTEGPTPGTKVVTVGASLLLGTEFKIGH